MSKMKKLVSVLLALVMVLAMTSTAFADTTGSITVKDSDTLSVAGKTFEAYRLLDLTITGEDDSTTDADERGYVYTVPDEWKDFFLGYFEDLDETSGSFSADVANAIASLSSSQLNAFGIAAANYAETNNISAAKTVTAGKDATSVTLSDLALGYYLVVDASETGTISAVILDSTNTAVEVTIKGDQPSLDKYIVETDEDGDEVLVDANNVSVGDTVTYKLTSSVPDMSAYTKYYFVVNDTLSKGLTYADNMTVTISYTDENGDSQTITLKNATDEGATDYAYLYDLTVTIDDETDETTLEIVFKDFIHYAAYTGADITITYNATLNEDAVIGVNGNDNTANLTYSNNPNETATGDGDNPDKPGKDDPVGETPEEKTTTYVTGIELTKINDAGDTLTGATFTLTGDTVNIVEVTTEVFTEAEDGEYWKLTDGTYTTTAPTVTGEEDDNSEAYDSTTTKYVKTISTEWVETSDTVTATATVNENGVLVFNGLSAGTYTITEIVAPDGYNLLDAPINLTISWSKTATASTCTWSVSSTEDTDSKKVATVNENGIITLNVVNNAGTELPSTGGMGTTIFYIVGSILVLGAAVLLITRKRMGRAE
ncbi:MAG: SpaH/EbpB family LPXTG-anchored major pilin [Lachnospiraceae bacterium]|nr:SpaH/EbpB family LPXTG-anchored major pilin [Lachnospiraceae bacterium]